MTPEPTQGSLASAGWGWPGRSKKCHYFPAGDSFSLCGKWGFYFGPIEPDTDSASKDDCAACRKKLARGVVQ